MQTVLKPKACSLPHAISQHRWNAGLRWTPPALDTKSENVGVDQQNIILIEKSPNSYVACAWPGLPVPLTSSVSKAWCLQQIQVRKHISALKIQHLVTSHSFLEIPLAASLQKSLLLKYRTVLVLWQAGFGWCQLLKVAE